MLINDLSCFKMFAKMVPFDHSPTVVWRGHKETGGGVRMDKKG